MTYIQTQFSVTQVTSPFGTPGISDNSLNNEIVNFLEELGDFLSSFRGPRPQDGEGPGHCGTVSPPNQRDCCHPCGTLKVDQEAGVITTPGGYKIEQLGQYDWKITGPDGKWTRCWGDPHVQEGDRANEATSWDFKRDSTFLLPDGTRINVKTKPYNNMTVTSELEVINGRDRVMVTGIDQGKGKVGEVTHDGFSRANARCGDVFVMGKESDDWYFQGREIIGSNDGGESFKLGDRQRGDQSQFLGLIEGFALKLMSSLYGRWPSGTSDESDRCRDRLVDQIQNLNQLFRAISQLRNLDNRITLGRTSFQC
jgi:Domain of Unknown Function (DUF1521)